MMEMYVSNLNLNIEYNKAYFLKSNRKRYGLIKKFLEDMAVLKIPTYVKDHNVQQPQIDAYITIEKKFTTLLSELDISNQQYYKALDMSFKGCNKLDTVPTDILEKDRKEELVSKTEIIIQMILDNMNKLKSYYNLNYSIMEIIFDNQFYAMYVIKGIRILFTYISLFLATRVFSPIYEETVYDKKGNPPPLWKYLLIFLAFDLSLNVFLVVVLTLLRFLFKSDDNSFVVDNYLFMKYITDYSIAMVIILVTGYMIGRVMMDKKYFKYRYEGLRAIRAYQSMMFSVAIVIIAIPYFLMI